MSVTSFTGSFSLRDGSMDAMTEGELLLSLQSLNPF